MKLKWTAIPVVILVAILIFVFFPKNKDIPEKLIGQWITSAPEYQDYYVKLTKNTITYGRNGGEKDVFTISSLEKNQEGEDIVYTLNYSNTDVKITRSFQYHPEDGGTIQFKHQENVTWRKKTDTAVK